MNPQPSTFKHEKPNKLKINSLTKLQTQNLKWKHKRGKFSNEEKYKNTKERVKKTTKSKPHYSFIL